MGKRLTPADVDIVLQRYKGRVGSRGDEKADLAFLDYLRLLRDWRRGFIPMWRIRCQSCSRNSLSSELRKHRGKLPCTDIGAARCAALHRYHIGAPRRASVANLSCTRAWTSDGVGLKGTQSSRPPSQKSQGCNMTNEYAFVR